jgi:hypothetical protein
MSVRSRTRGSRSPTSGPFSLAPAEASLRLEFGKRVVRRFTIHADDPLSARVDYESEHFLRRDQWRIAIRLRTAMSCTATSFLVTKDVDAFEGDVCVHSARNAVEVPRDGG